MQRKMEVIKKSWFSLLWENYASDGVSCRSSLISFAVMMIHCLSK